MGAFLSILNDIRSASNGHLRVSFFTPPHGACSVIQLTKWMCSPDEESDLSLFPIYCIFWSLRHYKAVTHLHSFTDDTFVFSGLSFEWQFQGVSSTPPASWQMQLKAFRKAMPWWCQCSLDNCESHSGSSTCVSPSEHQYYGIDSRPSQAKSNDASGMGRFLKCLYTNEKTTNINTVTLKSWCICRPGVLFGSQRHGGMVPTSAL